MVNKTVIDKIADNFNQDGLRFLLVFKTVKQEVQNECIRENLSLPDEEKLNIACAKITKQLLLSSAKTPSTLEIKHKVDKYKEKLKNKIE
ncbi:MAG: hypothetical protein NWE96_04050 [Candidatus Bathyarchaeota archaeon]|nr:hypothetical protein [Candidatus Bathyarchaeota archaeon]